MVKSENKINSNIIYSGMDINKYLKDNCLKVRVVPNSCQNKLIEENGQLKLYLRAVPEKNKANKELIKFFKKEFNIKVEIKSGTKSRDKMLTTLI